MTTKSYRLVIMAISLTLLTACDGCEESREWRKRAEAFGKQAEDFKKQWNTFGKQMVVAADAVDPLVLKELFRKNMKLQETIDELEKLTQSRAAGGELYLDTEQLRLSFDEFKGDMVVRAWVGTADIAVNPIATCDLRSTDPSLDIKYDVTKDYYVNALTAAMRKDVHRVGELLMERFKNGLGDIDEAYKARVNEALKNFLEKNAYETPKQTQHAWYLRDQLFRSGDHEIHIDVSPVHEDRPWALIATLTKVVGDKTEPLKTFEFSPAIPEQIRKHNYFTIRVKYRQAKADKVSEADKVSGTDFGQIRGRKPF